MWPVKYISGGRAAGGVGLRPVAGTRRGGGPASAGTRAGSPRSGAGRGPRVATRDSTDVGP